MLTPAGHDIPVVFSGSESSGVESVARVNVAMATICKVHERHVWIMHAELRDRDVTVKGLS